MTRPLFCALLLVGGCAKSYEVIPTQQGETPHYVIVQANNFNKRVKVYDCLSLPDGVTWDPTCRRVDMTRNAPGRDAARDASNKGE